MQLFLRFHHHTILVTSNERAVLEKLQEEFHFFTSQGDEVPDVRVDLVQGELPEIPAMVADRILEHVTIYRLGDRQYFDYQGEALTVRDHLEETIHVHSKDTERLFELGFLAIHSILGIKLDLAGFSRLHAVAISYLRTNLVVMLPSKGGKSTLLTNLLLNEQVKIISDDMPLVDSRGRIHPFPAKLGLNKIPEGPLSKLKWTEFKRTYYPPKWVAGLSQIKDRIETESANQPTILLAGLRLSRGKSFIQDVPKWKMIKPLLEHMIIGIGLPQIIELFLRFNLTDLYNLPKHFVIRSLAAFRLAQTSRCCFLYLGQSPTESAEVLLRVVNED